MLCTALIFAAIIKAGAELLLTCQVMCLQMFMLYDRCFSVMFIQPCLLKCVRAFDKQALSSCRGKSFPWLAPWLESHIQAPLQLLVCLYEIFKRECHPPTALAPRSREGTYIYIYIYKWKKTQHTSDHTNMQTGRLSDTQSQCNLFKINGPDFSVIKHQMHYSSIWASQAHSALSHIFGD